MNVLERTRGPLALLGALALLVGAGAGLVTGEFGVPSRISLAVGILLVGSSIAIDPEKALRSVTSRESVYGSNAVVLSVAFIGILAVGNILANRFTYRWDLTAQRSFSLSDATLKVLGDLPAPVRAKAFFSGNLPDRQKAEDLLKEYEARSGGKLTWEIVDTFLEPGQARLNQVNVDGTTQFRMGDRKQDTLTPDEAHLTTALIKLVNPEPVKVYYVTGHGERELDKFDDEGYSELRTSLQADNFVVEPLNLLATGRVPDDAKAIIIAAPRSPFFEQELDAVKRYLDGKGRLVLLVDPLMPELNVGEIIKRWDLTLGEGVVVDPVSAFGQDPTTVIVQRFGQHTIVRNPREVALMPFATSIEIPQFIKRGVDINGLAFTVDTRSWLETDRNQIRFDEGVDKKGPLILAVAVEEAENPETLQETLPGFEDPNKRVKNRAVIIGTSELVVNGLIKQPIANRDLFLNSLNWVTQTDQLITSRPIIEERRTVFLNDTQSRFVFFSSAVFFPLILLGLGGVVWWTRR